MRAARAARMGSARFALAFAATAAAVLAIGEGYARLVPPRDVREHFGYGAAAGGIYRPDPELGADYRSFESLREEYAHVLADLGPLDAAAPTWLLIGNSFVHAPGMLADTARAARPGTRIFNLPRNVDLPLRVAQARLLLRAGLRPERILFVLLPHDLWHIGTRPLAYIRVTADGAIATRARWPDPPLRLATDASRLAAIAWLRSGRAVGDPTFRPGNVASAPSARVLADLKTLLGILARSGRDFGVPVTVVAIPNREQIFGLHGTGFQDALRHICAGIGLDLYDAGPLFAADRDKRTLFLPDWHFSARGNSLLFAGLAEHLRSVPGARR